MRVLISGAGIAGPMLAWFLAKSGARITVIEKAPSLLPHGQSIDIEGSARTIVQKMGLLEEVKRYNTTEVGTKFVDSRGRVFAPLPMREDGVLSATSELEILRGDLAKVFYEATKDHPNVDYLFGTTIDKVVSNDDECVKVELSNGEMYESDILVAADGQWSKIRKQCFAPEDVKVVDKGMTAVYWTIPRIASDDDWWNVYLALGSRTLHIRPDPHGTMRAMFTRMPRNDNDKQAWLAASKSDRQTQAQFLKKEFDGAGWQTQRLLDSMDKAPDFYFHMIQQIRMSKWSNSRVVCVGDAAYAPTPLSGMGTSLAIGGAYILAGELSKLNDGEHPSRAFEAYESAFRPSVEKIQEIPSWIPGIAHYESAGKRWMFETFLQILSKIAAIPWLRERTSRPNDEQFPLPHYPILDELTSR